MALSDTEPLTALPSAPADLYLDLLARTLTRALFEDNDRIIGLPAARVRPKSWMHLLDQLAPLLRRARIEISIKRPYDQYRRENGRDWPARAETMVGLRRLTNIRFCVESVLREGVPGDLMETGVWRGGTSIFMRAILKAYGVVDRKVWLADSFQGMPPADALHFPADQGFGDLARCTILSVGVEEVRRNFERYGLMDEQVEFIVGWFRDTLADAPVERLALLRLDGDLYESTMLALDALYPKLSPGGYCVVDDYQVVPACKDAVSDYRLKHDIDDALIQIDQSGVFWRKGQRAES